MKAVIVIPARMGSSRFPGKPLAMIAGKPMIRWVFEAAVESRSADQVLIATPDPEIIEAAARFGAESVLTSNACCTGTDRVCEVAAKIEADAYINVQGDEPLMPAATIHACATALAAGSEVQVSTVCCKAMESEWADASTVKVVRARNGDAIYFSRFPIPYPRAPRSAPVLKHIGIYGYTRTALRQFSMLEQGPIELAESLEQLRFLENGIPIRVVDAWGTEVSVDTPDQASVAEAALKRR